MYIYVRTHAGYIFNGDCRVVKLGSSTNLMDRDATYSTGEVRRGVFSKIFEIHDVKDRYALQRVEFMLQAHLAKFRLREDGGSEFFLPDSSSKNTWRNIYWRRAFILVLILHILDNSDTFPILLPRKEIAGCSYRQVGRQIPDLLCRLL